MRRSSGTPKKTVWTCRSTAKSLSIKLRQGVCEIVDALFLFWKYCNLFLNMV